MKKLTLFILLMPFFVNAQYFCGMTETQIREAIDCTPFSYTYNENTGNYDLMYLCDDYPMLMFNMQDNICTSYTVGTEDIFLIIKIIDNLNEISIKENGTWRTIANGNIVTIIYSENKNTYYLNYFLE